MNGRPWTSAELALLVDMYPHCNTADVAAWLQRAAGSVYRAATARGVRKTEEYLQSVSSGRIQRGHQDPRMAATQFQPGIVPWNKGTSYQAGGRSAETRFRKGNRPQTWQPVGTYRVVKSKSGPVLELKTSERPGANHMRWTPVARLVWERHNGPVPEGCIVVFRPGMSTAVLEQITLERLECISRAEHARRNHPRNRSPELAKLIQLKGAITRQVNRIAREAQEQRT